MDLSKKLYNQLLEPEKHEHKSMYDVSIPLEQFVTFVEEDEVLTEEQLKELSNLFNKDDSVLSQYQSPEQAGVPEFKECEETKHNEKQ